MYFYNFLYSNLSKIILGYKLSLFSDVVTIIAAAYLLIGRGMNFSISGWLLNNALHQSSVNLFVNIVMSVIIVAGAIKILALIFENFPATKHAVVQPEHISACLQVMNNEIESHIKKCNEDVDSPNIRRLAEQHSFDVNIRLITDSLAEHIRQSFQTMKIKRKDLFISLYSYERETHSLVYELHFDSKRDLVMTKEITLSGEKYDSYECVKCMNTTNATCYVVQRSKYTKGSTKRFKSFQQYLGCKLEANGFVFGFLNIELHNHQIFNNEEEMQDFMEENIFPFKLLLEYQYLKRDFFGKFHEFEKHWQGV